MATGNDNPKLSSGRLIGDHIVGLTAAGEIKVYGGYDDPFHVSTHDDGETLYHPPTKFELLDVVDIMIARWTEARAKWST